MLRPKSILLFEKLWLAGIALGTVSLFVNYGTLREFAIANSTSPGAEFVGGFVGVLINVLFWYFIARRASNVAKWILVVMTVLGLVIMAFGAETYLMLGITYAISVSLLTVLEIAATILLFRADAVVWLKSRGANGVVDTQVFE